MKLYHGTNKKNLERIMSEGMIKTQGRFGEGCYFYTDKSEAEKWSDGSIYEVEVEDSSLLVIEYDKFFSKYHPELSLEEEEGYTKMNEYCTKGRIGVAITYRDNVTEVCLYTWDKIASSKYYYHVTHKDNYKAIMKEGLIPSIGKRSEELGESFDAVWLFPTIEDKDNAMGQWLGDWYNDEYGEEVELVSLKIILPANHEVYDLGAGYEVFSLGSIRPECIEYLKEE